MTNTNCLDGIRCPICKSFEPFQIEVRTLMKVFDSGTADHRDTQWDEDSYCECCECGFSGTIAAFSDPAPTPTRRQQGTVPPADAENRLLELLNRASFLLRRIHGGDHKALENALDCADSADAMIAKLILF